MKKCLLLLILPLLAVILLFNSCGSKKKSEEEAASSEDARFNAFKEGLVLKFWRLNPEWASSQGYHRYDSALVIPNNQYRRSLVRSFQAYLKDLEQFKDGKLSDNNRTDYHLISNFLQGSIWQWEEFKEYKWNPALYNLGGGVAEILNGRYDNLENRLKSISEKISRSVIYYETAIRNIKNPTLEHTQLAIEQNRGALTVFGQALLDSVKRSQLSDFEKDLLRQRVETTKLAIEGYIQHLQDGVIPAIKKGKTRSFRIGQEFYQPKFNFEMVSGYTPNEVYQKAMLRKKELHQEMERVTKKLWPKYFPGQPQPPGLAGVKKMISRLSESHVTREAFLSTIQQQIPELEKFVREKDLLTLDPSKPLVVRPTPAYMRGVAGASVSAPGPYDKNADTYYNVTPLDDYTPAQAESYLREYNQYLLQILNIHEAIPGHYAQLVYSNQSPSIIKAVLGNGAMVEGWAVYAEQMMLEQGYGNNSPELWLMWYKWNLRVTLNAILDFSVHVKNMGKEEALRMLMEEGFQEEAEAREKWKRVTLSQVQLASYFVGYTEIRDLREDLKKKQGGDFNLKAFHEQFLSYGSAPVKYIRQLMLEE